MVHVTKRAKSGSRLARTLLAGAMAITPAFPAVAQTWSGTSDNSWFTATNWSGDLVPNSSSAVAVIDNAQNNPVILNASAAVSTLTLGSGDSLQQTAGLFSISGGQISDDGSFELDGQLQLSGNDLTLSGSGALILNNGEIGGDGYGRTLFNGALIEGVGVIGSNSGALYRAGFSFNNSGTIDGNSSAGALVIQGAGGAAVNSGLLEATGGGGLNLAASGAALNNSGGVIAASGAGSTVNINMQVQGGVLTTTAGGIVETGGGAFLNGATANGAVTISNGSTYTAGTSGLTQAVGTLNLGSGVGPGGTLALTGQLQLDGGDLSLAGPGTLTMSGGAEIGGDGYGRTLDNGVTIEGSGVIGSNDGALYQGGFSINNSGTIDANLSGDTLFFQGTGGGDINGGLLEATNGGTLDLAAAGSLANAGANITASGVGSTVSVNMQIQGGALNTASEGVIETGSGGAILDGATSGPITISNGSTYTAGTSGLTQAVGTLDLGTGAGPGGTFALTGQLKLEGGDLTLAGPGVLTMSGNAEIGGDGYGRTLNNEVTIQGSGVIGSNDGALYQAGFSLNNSGTIDADASGQALVIQGNGGDYTNTGLLEATGGGKLDLTAVNGPLVNSGANITASGANSTVTVNMEVQGGTLNTVGGGVITTGGGAILNGATTNGAITISNGSTYTAGTSGLTKALGTLNLGSGVGAGGALALTGQLQLDGGDLTLAGPGTLTMSGNAEIGGDGYGRTLDNGVTIEGSGVIGSNDGALSTAGFSLNNSGTIDANLSGKTLFIVGSGGGFTNTGLLEATNGGTLDLAAVNGPLVNSGANVTASGAGSTVDVNMQVQGGALNTAGGGVIETGGSGAFLNGAAAGPITISHDSTYTAGTGALTKAVGTLILDSGATLALTGQLQLFGGDLTLSGPGAVTMSSGAQIGGDGYGRTLTNDTTIQGSGIVGSNAGALYSSITVVNDPSGTLLATGAGQTLTIAGVGGLTNNGVMQANAGATLNATQGFTNFAGGSLNGGTYNAYSGNIQINALGITGGEILTNNAHILLSGPTAVLSDSLALNALSQLATNADGASLTVENGNAFVSDATSSFANHGSVSVGAGSTFTTVSDYTQSGATSSTKVDGTLTPGSGGFYLASGELSGSGLVEANVANTGGLVNPGDPVGDLGVLGYQQGAGGTLEIDIASATSHDVLQVQGVAALDGELDPVFKSGFAPSLGESFVFLDYASKTGEFSGIENDVFDNGQYMWGVTYNATDAVLTVEQGPAGISAAPEPSAWALMLMSIGGMGLAFRRSKRRRIIRLKDAAAA